MSALGVGVSLVHVNLVSALALNNLSNTQSSLKANQLSDHTIQFVTPSGIAAGEDIQITFPVGYNLGSFNVTNVDFGTSTSASCTTFSQETLAGAPSGLTWGVSQASQTLTILSGTATIPANRCVQIKIGSNATFGGAGVSQIVNPGTPGLYIITIGGSFGDTGSISTYIVPEDTVSLTGTVQQSLTFTISTTTIYFGDLLSGSAKFASSTNTAGDTVDTTAHTLGVSTNAPYGFAITVRGDTLISQQNSNNTITAVGAVAASSTPGTEQFAIRATESGGTGVTIDSTYSQPTSYGFDASTSTPSLFATGTGVTLTSTISVHYLANVAAITEAGTYSTNLTYVATANF